MFYRFVVFHLNFTEQNEQQNQRAKPPVHAQNTADSWTVEKRKLSRRSKASTIRSREDETRNFKAALIRRLDEIRSRKDKHREEVEGLRREEDELRSLEEAQRIRWDEIQTQKDKHRKEADEVRRLEDEILIQKVYFVKRGYSD